MERRIIGLVGTPKLSLMHARFVPQRKLDAIVDSNLVVNVAQIVSNDVVADSELLCNLAVRQSPSD